MFNRRKRQNEELRKRTVHLQEQMALPAQCALPDPQLTGPIAELCADIAAHPEDYELSKCTVDREPDSITLTHRCDPQIQISSFGAGYGFEHEIYPWNSPEVSHFDAAFDAHAEHRQRAALERLAKVKAERKSNDEEAAARIKAMRSQNWKDWFETTADILGKPYTPDDRAAWAAHTERTDAGIAKASEPSGITIPEAFRILRPVLEGTHKIVPVDQPDAMTHLGEALDLLSNLHPDWRCYALDAAQLFFNENSTKFQIVPSEHYTLYPVSIGPLDRPEIDARGYIDCRIWANGEIERITAHAGPTTIETHTPGDDKPAMRDFLTDPGPVRVRATDADRRPWTDLDGRSHTTRACMRAADIEIRQRNR